MRKLSKVMLLSLFIFSRATPVHADIFSDYNIVMDEREIDTEVFDSYPHSKNGDLEEEWDDDETDDSAIHYPLTPQKSKSTLLPSVNRANVNDSGSQEASSGCQPHLDIEPTSIVNQVNVITGTYMCSEVDFVIPGAEPFVLQRNYVSADTDENGPFGKGWNRNYFGFVKRLKNEESKINHVIVTVLESGGSMYQYGGTHRYSLKMIPESYEDIVTNCGSGMMSARTNIRNNVLNYEEKLGICEFIKSTGERLTFEQQNKHRYAWHVKHERKPNGNQLDYTYLKDGNLDTLTCSNSKGKPLGQLSFEYGKGNGSEFVFINSEGKRKVSYRLQSLEGKKTEKAPFIVEVLRERGPNITYKYEDKHDNANIARIIRQNKPDGRFQEIEYYKHGTNWVGKNPVKIKYRNDPKLNRVMLQKAPVGHDATPIITHRYFYEQGYTHVFDAYDHKIGYDWDVYQRLYSIDRLTGTNKYSLYSKELFLWADPTTDQCSFLMGKSLEDGSGVTHYMRTFKYDHSGNVLEEKLLGNLTGDNTAPCKWGKPRGTAQDNGCEHYSTSYTYTPDDRYLMTSMTEGQVTQCFYYKDGTDLLEAKLFSANGKIFKREFYSYDENAILIKEVEDDGDLTDPNDLHGATERHIRYIKPRENEPVGLPDVIEEKYVDVQTGEEHLLKRMVHHYDENGRLRAKELFDANNAYLCTFEWEYDAHGNLIQETNPLGQTTIRRYDANDNKVFEQGPNLNVHKEFTYDYSNRLVRVDEIHTNGLTLSESHTYNYLNQKVGTVDIYGNETRYEYDDLGRQTKILLPPVVNVEGKLESFSDIKEYNLFNVVKSVTDFNGNTTSSNHNIRAKPICTTFADGSVEEMRYELDGSIRKHMHKNGSYTTYEYDHLKRVTFKRTFSPDGELLESSTYQFNTFHLLSEKDHAGRVKSYGYDAAGRLNEMIDGEKRTTYEYDSIGRLYKTKEYDGHGDSVCSVQLFDLLDRVIEEKREDAEGNLLTRVSYGYDVDGNRSTVTNYNQHGESTSTTTYDDRHQPLKVVDALGNTTLFHYKYDFCNEHGQIVPYSQSVDPMGNMTENIKDAQGRLVKLVQHNSLGELIHRKEFAYDKNGNKCRQVDVSQKGKQERQIITRWTYDCMNRLTTITEAVGEPEQRHTEFIYNPLGQRSQIIKPDGVRIDYAYDFLGRVVSQISSEGTINYSYHYASNGNLERVEDRIANLQSSCIYDDFDRVGSKTFLNGLSVGYGYDKANRPKVITFPDGTAVQYVYKAHRLTEVHRLSAEKQRKYSHRYTSYDTEDKLLEAKLVGKAGNVSYQYDALGRSTAVLYGSWQEEISGYDKVGNILTRDLIDPLEKIHCCYEYDDLYQVKMEKESGEKSAEDSKSSTNRTYLHDSFHNRLSKSGTRSQFNKLNQLLSDGKYNYKYDSNGNLICRKALNGEADGVMTFKYDAMDRLVTVLTAERRVGYLYDANNRRMRKRIEMRSEKGKPWKRLSEVRYIYIGQNEIGSYDKDDIAIELRLLGLSKGAEIGAAVAVELRGEVFTPLHDHQGNVTGLVNAKSGKLTESYRYTAFGEEQIFDAQGNCLDASINPWRFSSKRVDTETGFVYFGRRYYEPASGRWITPDPIGREGGPNLYAYVLNRTLTHSDLYGLYGTNGAGGGYNPVNAAFNWTRTFLNDATKFVAMSVNFAGRMIDGFAYHFVPVPIVRDALQIGGRVLSGQGFDDYHFTFCGKNTWDHLGLDEFSPIMRICMLGGILTTGTEMRARAEEESKRLGGCNVHYCATSSDGAVLDVVKAGFRCLGVSFPADQHIKSFIDGAYNSMEGSEDQRKILLDVHSQGARMLHNAKESIGTSICKRMDVRSYGCAKILDPDDFYDAHTYISTRDIVPFVSNPYSYISARLYPRSDVTFLKSKGLPFADHFWNDNTYQDVIIKNSRTKI